jgi:hypothetical protein
MTVMVSVRLNERLVKAMDTLAKRINEKGAEEGSARCTRATVHRKALTKGVKALEKKQKKLEGKDDSPVDDAPKRQPKPKTVPPL